MNPYESLAESSRGVESLTRKHSGLIISLRRLGKITLIQRLNRVFFVVFCEGVTNLPQKSTMIIYKKNIRILELRNLRWIYVILRSSLYHSMHFAWMPCSPTWHPCMLQCWTSTQRRFWMTSVASMWETQCGKKPHCLTNRQTDN